MQPEFPDRTSREGAEAHARELDAYWHAAGHPHVKWTGII
jgi:hypothetical protein